MLQEVAVLFEPELAAYFLVVSVACVLPTLEYALARVGTVFRIWCVEGIVLGWEVLRRVRVGHTCVLPTSPLCKPGYRALAAAITVV
jgi:hypothetical protein